MGVYHFFPSRSVHHFENKLLLFQRVPTKFRKTFFYLFGGNKSNCLIRLDEKYKSVGVLSNKLEYSITLIQLLTTPNTVIILHGYSLLFFIIVGILPFTKAKVKWVVWGAGINRHKGIKGGFTLSLRRYLYQKVNHISCTMKPDADKLRNDFLYKGDIRILTYNSQKRKIPLVSEEEAIGKKDCDVINILIGNSAHVHNQHIEILSLLSKFRNENLKIHLFLNYGGSDHYIKNVIKFGEEKFGNKLVTFQKLLPLQEYQLIIKNMNILIMSATKQTGLGAIYNVIDFGGVVFLNKNSDNKTWLDSFDIKTGEIEDIPKMNEIKELNFLSVSERIENSKKRINYFNTDRSDKMWSEFINL